MPTKKDQGNSLFKSQRYHEAIQCYLQYVSSQHNDNSKAYNNMALAYYKIKDFKECIKACEQSIQLEPQFEKPYFRMYEAYRQLKDWYNILIVGEKFMKLSKDEKEIALIRKDMATVKEKLSYDTQNEKKISQADKIIQEILNFSHPSQDKITNGQIKQVQCGLDTKWETVEKQMKNNAKNGMNLAWKFILQQCHDESSKAKYKKLLAEIQRSRFQNTQTNRNNELQQEQSSNVSQEQKQAIKTLPTNYPTQNSQNIKIQIQPHEQQQQIEVETTQNHSTQIEVETSDNNITAEQTVQNNSNQPIVPIDQNELELLFKTYLKSKIQKAKDQFACFYQCLSEILTSSDLSKSQKHGLLTVIPKRLSNFNLLKKFSKKQAQILKAKAEQHGLSELMLQLYFSLAKR